MVIVLLNMSKRLCKYDLNQNSVSMEDLSHQND